MFPTDDKFTGETASRNIQCIEKQAMGNKRVSDRMSLAAAGIVYTTSSYVYSDSQSSDSEHVASDPYLRKAQPDGPGGMPSPPPTDGIRLISAAELAKHTTREEGRVASNPAVLWVSIEGVVWSVGEFVDRHPGGAKIIIQNCGKDATALFKSLHPPNTIEENLPPEAKVGMVDPSELDALMSSSNGVNQDTEAKIKKAREEMMGVDGMVNLDDFEELAHKILTPAALAYYASGSDDEWTMHANRDAYRRIRFRPRVLRRVGEVDASTEILGVKTTLPIFIAPAALAKLGHPLGEVNLTRGAGETGILQVISSNSSCSLDELAEERREGQELAWQLYVATDRDRAEKTIKKAFNLGMSSIWLTVDAPVGGNRERDTKEKIARDPPKLGEKADGNSGSTSAAQFSYVDPNLTWEDISWIKSLAPGKPLVIKGISCVEDAILAKEHGCQGIVLSNHGGRQLDGARPPIDVLQEIRRERPELLKEMEVYVDGGIRRGTDVLKALCLGAKAVGLGRPFLYAQSAYGEDGVVKAVQILEEEIQTGMRLLGVTKISELKPEFVECLPP
ncbi:hypothetical protein QFC21_004917 [Naganishia friedmannii]|uniref:Uncharacterized protein n=1 Tax=Naganishia friedmannii TaxID=89922 RepID=A0ACC2VDU8_9TREE|nr:hypothetical protein QFC21_004917 [Naganishia friedmannii]